MSARRRHHDHPAARSCVEWYIVSLAAVPSVRWRRGFNGGHSAARTQ